MEIEYCPELTCKEVREKCKIHIPLDTLADLGTEFSLVAANIASIAMKANEAENVKKVAEQAANANKTLKDVIDKLNEGPFFRCEFPEGINGHLTKAKDGSGFLGTIRGDKNIVGQARWQKCDFSEYSKQLGSQTPVELNSIPPIDPAILAVSVAMMNINRKLDTIQETQQEILTFLHQEKESDLEGAVNTLADILGQYRFNSGNDIWKSSCLTNVTAIKAKAQSNIIFYRKEVEAALEKKAFFHGNQQADKMKKKLQKALHFYQLSAYLYAYSSFLEVLLGGNYTEEYLSHVSEKVKENSNSYRESYEKCYAALKKYMKTAVPTQLIGGIGGAGKTAGNVIAKIPIISMGPVDEALIAAGSQLGKFSGRHGNRAMAEFEENSGSGEQIFTRAIDQINELQNTPKEVLFDENMIYILME